MQSSTSTEPKRSRGRPRGSTSRSPLIGITTTAPLQQSPPGVPPTQSPSHLAMLPPSHGSVRVPTASGSPPPQSHDATPPLTSRGAAHATRAPAQRQEEDAARHHHRLHHERSDTAGRATPTASDANAFGESHLDGSARNAPLDVDHNDDMDDAILTQPLQTPPPRCGAPSSPPPQQQQQSSLDRSSHYHDHHSDHHHESALGGESPRASTTQWTQQRLHRDGMTTAISAGTFWGGGSGGGASMSALRPRMGTADSDSTRAPLFFAAAPSPAPSRVTAETSSMHGGARFAASIPAAVGSSSFFGVVAPPPVAAPVPPPGAAEGEAAWPAAVSSPRPATAGQGTTNSGSLRGTSGLAVVDTPGRRHALGTNPLSPTDPASFFALPTIASSSTSPEAQRRRQSLALFMEGGRGGFAAPLVHHHRDAPPLGGDEEQLQEAVPMADAAWSNSRRTSTAATAIFGSAAVGHATTETRSYLDDNAFLPPPAPGLGIDNGTGAGGGDNDDDAAADHLGDGGSVRIVPAPAAVGGVYSSPSGLGRSVSRPPPVSPGLKVWFDWTTPRPRNPSHSAAPARAASIARVSPPGMPHETGMSATGSLRLPPLSALSALGPADASSAPAQGAEPAGTRRVFSLRTRGIAVPSPFAVHNYPHDTTTAANEARRRPRDEVEAAEGGLRPVDDQLDTAGEPRAPPQHPSSLPSSPQRGSGRTLRAPDSEASDARIIPPSLTSPFQAAFALGPMPSHVQATGSSSNHHTPAGTPPTTPPPPPTLLATTIAAVRSGSLDQASSAVAPLHLVSGLPPMALLGRAGGSLATIISRAAAQHQQESRSGSRVASANATPHSTPPPVAALSLACNDDEGAQFLCPMPPAPAAPLLSAANEVSVVSGGDAQTDAPDGSLGAVTSATVAPLPPVALTSPPPIEDGDAGQRQRSRAPSRLRSVTPLATPSAGVTPPPTPGRVALAARLVLRQGETTLALRPAALEATAQVEGDEASRNDVDATSHSAGDDDAPTRAVALDDESPPPRPYPGTGSIEAGTVSVEGLGRETTLSSDIRADDGDQSQREGDQRQDLHVSAEKDTVVQPSSSVTQGAAAAEEKVEPLPSAKTTDATDDLNIDAHEVVGVSGESPALREAPVLDGSCGPSPADEHTGDTSDQHLNMNLTPAAAGEATAAEPPCPPPPEPPATIAEVHFHSLRRRVVISRVFHLDEVAAATWTESTRARVRDWGGGGSAGLQDSNGSHSSSYPAGVAERKTMTDTVRRTLDMTDAAPPTPTHMTPKNIPTAAPAAPSASFGLQVPLPPPHWRTVGDVVVAIAATLKEPRLVAASLEMIVAVRPGPESHHLTAYGQGAEDECDDDATSGHSDTRKDHHDHHETCNILCPQMAMALPRPGGSVVRWALLLHEDFDEDGMEPLLHLAKNVLRDGMSPRMIFQFVRPVTLSPQAVATRDLEGVAAAAGAHIRTKASDCTSVFAPAAPPIAARSLAAAVRAALAGAAAHAASAVRHDMRGCCCSTQRLAAAVTESAVLCEGGRGGGGASLIRPLRRYAQTVNGAADNGRNGRRIIVVLPALRLGDVIAAPPLFTVGGATTSVADGALPSSPNSMPSSGLFHPTIGARAGHRHPRDDDDTIAACDNTNNNTRPSCASHAAALSLATFRIVNARANPRRGDDHAEWLRQQQHDFSGEREDDGRRHHQQLVPPLFTVEEVSSGRRIVGVAPWLIDWVRL